MTGGLGGHDEPRGERDCLGWLLKQRREMWKIDSVDIRVGYENTATRASNTPIRPCGRDDLNLSYRRNMAADVLLCQTRCSEALSGALRRLGIFSYHVFVHPYHVLMHTF